MMATTRAPGIRAALLLSLGIGSLLLLAACTAPPPLVSDAGARATATARGCFPYGSYEHVPLSATPTPTGSWTPPTLTPRPPPPPQTPCADPPCPYLLPTRTAVPAWPPPAITCTPRPEEPTVPPGPTAAAAYWPPRVRQPALAAIVGNTEPVVLGAGLGWVTPGSASVDPRTGRLWISYSLLNPDVGYENTGRIYVRTVDPATGVWRDATTVNEAGYYHLRAAPESAVAAGADGRVHVIYPRRASVDGDATVEYRVSTDEGQSWSAPVALPGTDGPLADSLRLTVDAANQVHMAYVSAGGSTPGWTHYYESLAGGGWRVEIRPVGGAGMRDKSVDVRTFRLADGTIRTMLAWIEVPPFPPGGFGAVYVAHKDGPGGAWTAPTLLIDGRANPYGLPDYDPRGLRLLSFTDAGRRAWVYLWWAIYSTGRICFAYSADGGQSWGPTTAEGWHEDAVVYYNRFAHPVPGPDERSRGTAHDPAPIWDAIHQRIITLYTYEEGRAGVDPDSFPAYAYGWPGAPGTSWQGYATFTTTPWRIAQATHGTFARGVFATTGPGAGGYVFAGWVGRDGAEKFYGLLINPATLISDGDVQP